MLSPLSWTSRLACPTQVTVSCEAGARGEIVKSRDASVIRVSGLRPRRGRVYELWLVRKGSRTPEPSSLLAVADDGSGASGIPGGLEGVQEVMVSSEPEGGSPQPTTMPVLRARL